LTRSIYERRSPILYRGFAIERSTTSNQEGEPVRSPYLRWVALVAAIGALALPASAFGIAQITELEDGLRDYDARSGAIAPTGAQRAAVRRLHAAVTWSQFGTPATLSKRGKYLAKGVRGKTASAATRRWLHRNRALFRLASTAGLEVVGDSRLSFSRGHAVHLRQVFGGLETVDGGMVTIGLTGSARKGWNIAFASSSLTSDTAVDGRARLSAIQGFAAASRGAGAGYSVTQVRGAKTTAGGWTQLRVRAAGSIQRVRAVAFPTVRSGVIPAYESYVSKGDDAYRVVVDGRNGALLARQSTIFNAAEGFAAVNTIPLSGEVPGTEAACGPDHSFSVGAGVRYLDGYAIAAHPLNDMVLLLIKDGTTLISADSNFSPERFQRPAAQLRADRGLPSERPGDRRRPGGRGASDAGGVREGLAQQRQHGHRDRRLLVGHEHVPLAAAAGRVLRPVRRRRLRPAADRPRVRPHDREPDDRQGRSAPGPSGRCDGRGPR
jgi:hypothetical protein